MFCDFTPLAHAENEMNCSERGPRSVDTVPGPLRPVQLNDVAPVTSRDATRVTSGVTE